MKIVHIRSAAAVRSRLVALIAVAVLTFACGGQSPTSPSSTYPTPTITALPSLDEMLAEKVIGSPSAPNTVVVYSSYTCPACASFDLNVLPRLRVADLDTGRALFVFREYPRDTGPDLTAAMLARCSGTARFFDAVATIFRNQSAWNSGGDEYQALVNVMRQFGMAQSVVDECRANTALQNAILQNRFGVSAPFVPTIIVNGTSLSETEVSTVLGLSLEPIERYFR